MTQENTTSSNGVQLRGALTFFRSGLTQINAQRLSLNNTKRIVKYVVHEGDVSAQSKLALLDTPVGYLSFLLYYARFANQIILLINCDDDKEQANGVYPKLLNDLLWGTCNLIQFYWWSFKVSSAAGYKGLQLEVCAQVIDLVIMMANHHKDYDAHLQEMAKASPETQKLLLNEWDFKRKNFIRAFIHASVIVSALAFIAFAGLAIPTTPVFFTVGIVSGLLKNLMQLQKEITVINLLKEAKADDAAIQKQERVVSYQQSNTPYQLMFNHVLLPVSFYLLVTTAILVAIPLVSVTFLLSEWLKPRVNEIATEIAEEQIIDSDVPAGSALTP